MLLHRIDNLIQDKQAGVEIGHKISDKYHNLMDQKDINGISKTHNYRNPNIDLVRGSNVAADDGIHNKTSANFIKNKGALSDIKLSSNMVHGSKGFIGHADIDTIHNGRKLNFHRSFDNENFHDYRDAPN